MVFSIPTSLPTASITHWNSSAVYPWSSHQCHRITEVVMSLPPRSVCRFWHHWPQHPNHAPFIVYRFSLSLIMMAVQSKLGRTDLMFFNLRVKMNVAYSNVLLTQKLQATAYCLSREICREFIILQDKAPAHRAWWFCCKFTAESKIGQLLLKLWTNVALSSHSSGMFFWITVYGCMSMTGWQQRNTHEKHC